MDRVVCGVLASCPCCLQGVAVLVHADVRAGETETGPTGVVSFTSCRKFNRAGVEEAHRRFSKMWVNGLNFASHRLGAINCTAIVEHHPKRCQDGLSRTIRISIPFIPIVAPSVWCHTSNEPLVTFERPRRIHWAATWTICTPSSASAKPT